MGDFEQREGRVDRYRGHAIRKEMSRPLTDRKRWLPESGTPGPRSSKPPPRRATTIWAASPPAGYTRAMPNSTDESWRFP